MIRTAHQAAKTGGRDPQTVPGFGKGSVGGDDLSARLCNCVEGCHNPQEGFMPGGKGQPGCRPGLWQIGKQAGRLGQAVIYCRFDRRDTVGHSTGRGE